MQPGSPSRKIYGRSRGSKRDSETNKHTLGGTFSILNDLRKEENDSPRRLLSSNQNKKLSDTGDATSDWTFQNTEDFSFSRW